MENHKNPHVKRREKFPRFFDYFRFGESYTSLILGILVVIISTGLILGIVHNRNVIKRDVDQPQVPQDLIRVSHTDTETIISSATNSAKQAPVQIIKTKVAPTNKPQVVIKNVKPTAKPTQLKQIAIKAKPIATPTTKSPASKPTMAIAASKSNNGKKDPTKIYMVNSGDNLWEIAVTNYNNGYKWVEIARSNNLSNPDKIEVGQKLTLSKIEQKKDTPDILPEAASTSRMAENAKIGGSEYKVAYGDSLWTIAVRAYGDGYQWVKISSTNNLSNPNLIYPGDKLIIPRK